ncbi:uncharacterized protein LOC105845506 isoform X2 [Hydra vulgaris]|uniref:uncharacterized protein LOC105845506 isoform X2 n=1 Tax=Hydra vulgaris TaxID=6087 RepID=UPI001F5EF0B2|nr:uncharacterized protein LOC105845506 isoform X2 [Hydra vulgaris]
MDSGGGDRVSRLNVKFKRLQQSDCSDDTQNRKYQSHTNSDSSNGHSVYNKVPNNTPDKESFVINQHPGIFTSGENYAGPLPKSHSLLAWLTCLFCCWPISIVSIIKSNEVTHALGRGDILRARIASESAKKFGYASLGCGIFVQLTIFIVAIILFTVVLPTMGYRISIF